jgi:predicted  nucleic acid-binding Zn-ribbon protein
MAHVPEEQRETVKKELDFLQSLKSVFEESIALSEELQSTKEALKEAEEDIAALECAVSLEANHSKHQIDELEKQIRQLNQIIKEQKEEIHILSFLPSVSSGYTQEETATFAVFKDELFDILRIMAQGPKQGGQGSLAKRYQVLTPIFEEFNEAFKRYHV